MGLRPPPFSSLNMITNAKSRACAPRSHAPRLRPTTLLTALLAALPLTALAQEASLDPVVVKDARSTVAPLGAAPVDRDTLQSTPAASSDSANLLRQLPGVSLQGAGGVSSLPSVHGMTDDRLRIQVDGMDLVSACGNHMNPPLSYIDPTRVGSVRLYAGITPVSLGGDSIGATIQVESAEPEFAAPGQGTLLKGQAGAFSRSNNHAKGMNASATMATESLSLRYDGATAKADNYHAGRDFKAAGPAAVNKPTQWLDGDEVGSSHYKTTNQSLAMAWRQANHLTELKLGVQDIPYQGFPNQRMDMTGNDSEHVNLRIKGRYDWGQLQARAYHENTRHAMNFGDDKQFWYGPTNNVPGMPMDTEGKTTGLSVKADVVLNDADLLRTGIELQRYRLDDWWLPSGGGMAPDTFWNIRDGQRDRLDLFGEWEARWNPQWLSLLGLRSANVSSNSGPVQGYNAGYAADANPFNARERERKDHNWDMAALARYTPSADAAYEFGYARKTRSPNLYERYTWSTGGMAMRMINLAGDGNGYVGNLDLAPEIAHTLSATADWHDATGEAWALRLTPYLTYVDNYINARRCRSSTAMSPCTAANQTATQGFVYLQFANEDARLHGLDLSGFTELGKTANWGRFTLTGQLSYTKGQSRTYDDHLYNIMPVNARLALVQRLGGFSATAELQMVGGKSRVSQVRNELHTGGYGLLNLRASHEGKRLRFDVGIDNLFDRFYQHPQGGAYTGQGKTMSANDVPWGVAVPGMGRSVHVGMTVKF